MLTGRGSQVLLCSMILALFLAADASEGRGRVEDLDERAGEAENDGDAAMKVQLGFTDSLTEKTVSLEKGKVLDLVLDSNPTTGYKWFLQSVDGDSVEKDGNNFLPPQAGLIGAGGKEVWHFKGSGAGTSKIIMDYK